jgi:hypothetical protein
MNSIVSKRFQASLAIVFVGLSIASAQTTAPSVLPSPSEPNTSKKLDSAPHKEDQAEPNKDKVTGGGKMTNETKASAPDYNAKTTKITRITQGDELSIEIGDLKKRIEKQPNVVTTTKLFLDCKPVEGLQPRSCLSQNKIIFVLDRATIQQITSRTKIVSVGVGFNDAREPEVLMPEKLELVSVPYDLRLGAVLVFALVLVVSLWLCGRSTNLLRDQPPPDGNGMRGPFSLAKVQMAWWLFFVAWAFLFICVAVGNFDSVTTSTLVLLGISAGTTAGSKMVDSSKQKTAQDLRVTTAALNTQIAAAPEPALPVVQAKAIQLQQATAQLNDLQRPQDQLQSRGLLTDIMSDENGISIHRFQMVVWTVVLTAIFVWKVCQDFAMPEFSTTLLTLMGISAGAYVTLKVPEKHSVVVP